MGRKRGLLVSPRVYRLCTNGWGIGIGLIAVFACLIHFFWSSGTSAVDVQLGVLADAYYIVYGASGALIIGGLVACRDDVDALGLALFIGGLTINLVALLATISLGEAVPGIASWLALTLGATTRLLIVTRVVRLKPPPEPAVSMREAVRMVFGRRPDDETDTDAS